MAALITELTEPEVQEFVMDWYQKLDVHAPPEAFRPLIDDGFEIIAPDFKGKGWEGFQAWYERAIRLFFDEVHTIKEVNPKSLDDEKMEVKVVVRWEASRWEAPKAKSDRIIMDAYQTWLVKRSPQTGKPMIVTYLIDRVEYAAGSAQL